MSSNLNNLVVEKANEDILNSNLFSENLVFVNVSVCQVRPDVKFKSIYQVSIALYERSATVQNITFMATEPKFLFRHFAIFGLMHHLGNYAHISIFNENLHSHLVKLFTAEN